MPHTSDHSARTKHSEGLSSRPRLTQACAECRRLKLKCDKNKPCSSCIRRGCPSICPEGRMVSKGSRFILADTEQLHKKIDTLISRVHELEVALEESHAMHSNEIHPLLSEDRRLLATPLDSAAAEPQKEVKEELAESLGTLTLDDRGARYFGATGAFAYMWRSEEEDAMQHRKAETAVIPVLAELPSELAHMAYSFPFRLTNPAPLLIRDPQETLTNIVEKHLPPYGEAWSLFENFWEHYAWHFTPISRSSFIEQILTPIYRGTHEPNMKPLSHRLGLLFSVFAIGELLDFTKPLTRTSGMKFYLLARACLCIENVFESPSITALQGLILLCIYGVLSRGWTESEHVWVLSGINLKLALTLGLHNDPTKFDLPSHIVENRWYALYAIMAMEVWQSLTLGRSPSIPLLHKLEKLKPLEDSEDDNKCAARYWAACFIRDISLKVVETIVGNKPISYSAILQLDAKVRAYPSFYKDEDPLKDAAEELGIGERMQRAFFRILRESMLLLLHRRCFALALRDHPDDPLASPFAPSVMACYRGATTFINRIYGLYVTNPTVTQRIWFYWPNVFAGTLILGSICARSPNCSIAAQAYNELQTAMHLWEGAPEDFLGSKVWDAIDRLRKKATMAMAQSKFMQNSRSPSCGVEVSEEILALGGGGPRVIRGPSRAGSVNSHGSPYSNTDSSPGPPQVPGTYPQVEVKQEPSITQVLPPQTQTSQQQSLSQPQQAGGMPPYFDTVNFLNQGLFAEFNNNVAPSISQMQSPSQDFSNLADQNFTYLPAEFNDIFGVNTDQTADVYGSDVLGQMGFEMPYQAMDHLQMSL